MWLVSMVAGVPQLMQFPTLTVKQQNNYGVPLSVTNTRNLEIPYSVIKICIPIITAIMNSIMVISVSKFPMVHSGEIQRIIQAATILCILQKAISNSSLQTLQQRNSTINSPAKECRLMLIQVMQMCHQEISE